MKKLLLAVLVAIPALLITVPAPASADGPNVNNSGRNCKKDCYTNSNGQYVCHTYCW